jgi:hypothetical protein
MEMNEKKDLPEYRRSMDRVLINMRGAGDRYGAVEMDFYLNRLKEETGASRQYTVFSMLRYAFEHDERFDDVRERLKTEWRNKTENQ